MQAELARISVAPTRDVLDRMKALLFVLVALLLVLVRAKPGNSSSGWKWERKRERPRNSQRRGVISDERRLLEYLLKGYDRTSRPVARTGGGIVVNISIVVNTITTVDEKNQELFSNLWIDQKWFDDYLRWNTTDFGGIETVRLPSNLVWLPDTYIYNAAGQSFKGFMEPMAALNLLVRFDGQVHWPYPMRLQSTCRFDILLFPFDYQSCPIRFGSWSFSDAQVDFRNFSDGVVNTSIDLAVYSPNSEWDLVSAYSYREVKTYESWPEKFPEVIFTINIRRKPLYYLFNLIIPCVLLSYLTILIFLLPTSSGEKATLGITVFLAYSVFMLLVAESTPEQSDVVPFIVLYFTVVMVKTSLASLWGVACINISAKVTSNPHRPPRFLRKICFQYLAKVVCMKSRIDKFYKAYHMISPGDYEEEIHVLPSGREIRPSRVRRMLHLRQVTKKGTCIRKNMNGSLPSPIATRSPQWIPLRVERRYSPPPPPEPPEPPEKKSDLEREWFLICDVFDRLFLIVYFILTTLITFMMLFLLPHVSWEFSKSRLER